MTEAETRASIAAYLERLAGQHKKAAERDYRYADFHGGAAILYRARASDILGALDLADPPRNINTGEVEVL